MLELNLAFFAAALPATLFAGISKGGFGSGAAFVSATILALILDPKTALGVMLPLLMLIDLATLKPYWNRWNWPDARLLLFGGVPGVICGVLLFRVAPDDAIRLIIGAISIGFVVWHAGQRCGWFRPNGPRVSSTAGVLAGVAVGFTSFVSHAGGPPVAMYLLARKLDKSTYQATTVLVFWLVNIVKFVPYAALGMFTLETLESNLLLAPAALIGAWVGVKLHRIVSSTALYPRSRFLH